MIESSCGPFSGRRAGCPAMMVPRWSSRSSGRGEQIEEEWKPNSAITPSSRLPSSGHDPPTFQLQSRTVFFCIQCVFCAPQGCACPCFLCKEITSLMDFFFFFFKAGVSSRGRIYFKSAVQMCDRIWNSTDIQMFFTEFCLKLIPVNAHPLFSNLIPEIIFSRLHTLPEPKSTVWETIIHFKTFIGWYQSEADTIQFSLTALLCSCFQSFHVAISSAPSTCFSWLQ